MEFLDAVSGVASVAGGGVLGIVGSVIGSVFKGKQIKEDRKHELAKVQIEQAINQQTHNQGIETITEERSSSGLIASIQADASGSVPGWAAGIKALFRPFLTTLLVIVSAYIFTLLLGAINGENNALSDVFPTADIVAMIRYTVYSLIFSTATAITWWFGDRALSPPSMK